MGLAETGACERLDEHTFACERAETTQSDGMNTLTRRLSASVHATREGNPRFELASQTSCAGPSCDSMARIFAPELDCVGKRSFQAVYRWEELRPIDDWRDGWRGTHELWVDETPRHWAVGAWMDLPLEPTCADWPDSCVVVLDEQGAAAEDVIVELVTSYTWFGQVTNAHWHATQRVPPGSYTAWMRLGGELPASAFGNVLPRGFVVGQWTWDENVTPEDVVGLWLLPEYRVGNEPLRAALSSVFRAGIDLRLSQAGELEARVLLVPTENSSYCSLGELPASVSGEGVVSVQVGHWIHPERGDVATFREIDFTMTTARGERSAPDARLSMLYDTRPYDAAHPDQAPVCAALAEYAVACEPCGDGEPAACVRFSAERAELRRFAPGPEQVEDCEWQALPLDITCSTLGALGIGGPPAWWIVAPLIRRRRAGGAAHVPATPASSAPPAALRRLPSPPDPPDAPPAG